MRVRTLVITRCLSLGLITIALIACQIGEKPVVTLTEDNNGKPVTMKQNEDLQVVLIRDPQSDLEWDVQGYDPALMKLRPPVVDNRTPQPGDRLDKQFVEFEPRSRGTTSLRIVYHDPAHPETPPTKTFEVTVTIE